jgi:hypothetical protein
MTTINVGMTRPHRGIAAAHAAPPATALTVVSAPRRRPITNRTTSTAAIMASSGVKSAGPGSAHRIDTPNPSGITAAIVPGRSLLGPPRRTTLRP